MNLGGADRAPRQAVPPVRTPAVESNRLTVVRGGAGNLAALILRKLEERRSAIGSNGARVSRSLMIASALMLVLFVLTILVIPAEHRNVHRVDLPEPARTIIAEPLPEPPAMTETPRVVAPEPLTVQDIVSRPSAEPSEPPRLMRRRELDPDAGQAGRERARRATSQLAASTAALDHALGDLSASLGAVRGGVTPARRARRRDVRTGRSEGELGGLEAGLRGSSADVAGSAVEGKMVALGMLASSSAASADEGGGTAGAAPGVFRSNASLLAVIQKYAPGIQYCYENELKRDPGRRGKLVVAMTVAANGSVAQATVVQNTLGSERLAACALSQIRDWKFPAIAGGFTTFQAPFLFTPPE